MQSRTITQTTLFLCLLLSTFLHGQITIDYPERITVECGADITPSRDNPVVGFPDINTSCLVGIPDISFTDDVDQLDGCGGTGVVLRFWSVSDNCGGFSTLLQRITIEDTTPPEINCVSDVVIECDASLNPAENPDLAFPGIIDCSEGEDLTIRFVDLNEGDGFCDNLPEIVRRTWIVTDACGNESICEQSIRVGRDPLLILCEVNDIVHECNGLDGSRFAAESWDLSNTNQLRNCTQTDCGPVEIVSDFDYGRIEGPCGITGSFEVNYLIRDNCGNSKFRTVSFTLRDTTPPESFCNPIDFGVSCEGDETAASRVEGWHADNIALLETCLFDNCGEVVISSDFNPNNFNINNLNFDCNDDAGFAVNYTLTDLCGNVSVKTAFLNVVDNVPPTFENIPRDTSIGANDNLPAIQPTIVDNCANNLTAEFSEERIDNDDDDGYELIRTWTTTDDCGNMATASQTVMVLDPILSLACTSAEIRVEGDRIVISNLLAPNEIVKVFASDERIVYNCFRDCGDVQTTRALAEDTYTVDIEFYTTDWQLICTDLQMVNIGNGASNNGETNDNNNSEGNNNGGTDDNSGGSNSGGTGGNNTDPCTGTDCEQEPPSINNFPADITVNENAIPAVANPTATDNCDTDVNLTFTENRTDDPNSNSFVLTRIWTAIDDCGNRLDRQQIIRVEVAGGTADNNGGGNGDTDNNNDGDTGSNEVTDPSICGDVIISTGPSTFNFANLNAPNVIVKVFDENFNIVLECTQDCGTAINFPFDIPGTYFADVQLYTSDWTFICETRQTVELSNTPVDNGGSGNVEICAAVDISMDNGTINVNNIDAPNKIVKLFDENFNVLSECSNDCSTPVSFSPSTGNYFVDVQLYTAEWTFICEIQEPISVTAINTDNQSDDPCDNVNISSSQTNISLSNFSTPNKIINIFDENFNLVFNCFTDCADDINAPISDLGFYLIDIQLYNADWSLVCQQRRTIEINENSQSGSNNSENDNQSNNQACEVANITTQNGQINISNLDAPNTIIKVFSENFDLVFECVGDCGNNVTTTNLIAGNYQVNINFFDENWGPICERVETLNLGSSLTTTETPSNIPTTSSRIANTGNNNPPSISLYPNPATDKVIFNVSNMEGRQLNFRIYNQLAAVVKEGKFDITQENTFSISLQGIENGLYLVQLQIEEQSPITKKLLVNKHR